MKTLSTLVCLGLCLSFGCQDAEDNTSAMSLRITADKLVETEGFAVLHAAIEAPGERYVRVSVNGKILCESSFKPTHHTNTLQLEIVFVATLIKTAGSPNMIKWFMQAEYGGVGIAHPEMTETEAQTLSEILTLNTLDGPSHLGKDVVLGEFQKAPIVVFIE